METPIIAPDAPRKATFTKIARIPMLPLGGVMDAVTSRSPGFAAALMPICIRDGAVDWLCSECGFVIFQGLVHPERIRYLTVRCPNCDVYQRSLA